MEASSTSYSINSRAVYVSCLLWGEHAVYILYLLSSVKITSSLSLLLTAHWTLHSDKQAGPSESWWCCLKWMKTASRLNSGAESWCTRRQRITVDMNGGDFKVSNEWKLLHLIYNSKANLTQNDQLSQCNDMLCSQGAPLWTQSFLMMLLWGWLSFSTSHLFFHRSLVHFTIWQEKVKVHIKDYIS